MREIVINRQACDDPDRFRAWVDSLPSIFEREGRCVYDKRNTIKIIERGDVYRGAMAVKRFKRLGWMRGSYYHAHTTGKARRGYDNGLRLLAAGESTPMPLAWVEINRRGALVDQYLVTEAIDTPRPIREGLTTVDALDHRLAEEFGRYVARLHSKGILHHDLNCDNVLYTVEPDGNYRFTLIDINRMSFVEPAGMPSDRECVSNLCLFSRDEDVIRTVATHYCAARGWDVSRAEEFVKGMNDFVRRRRVKKTIVHPMRHLRAFVNHTPIND